MLQYDVIEPATNEWTSTISFSPKKDGSLQFCVDDRSLNVVTISKSYSLLRMVECIALLEEAAIILEVRRQSELLPVLD